MGVRLVPSMPFEQLLAIRGRHVAGLSLARLQVLAALTIGFTDRECAARLGISEATVRRHRANVQAQIFDPLEIIPSHWLLATWFWQHTTCCTASAVKMIETGHLFDRHDHRSAG